MNLRLARKKSPLELFDVARAGGEADTVKRVLGLVLVKEADAIISQMGSVKPDLGSYAFLAGQSQMLKRILTSLNLTLNEAREAGENLRKVGM